MKLIYTGYLLFLLFFPLLSFAKQGTLIIKQGVVKVKHQEVTTIYKERVDEVALYQGDYIRTGDRTIVKLFLRDNTEKITIYSNSVFEIEAIQKKRSKVSLWFGKASFAITSLLSRGSNKDRFTVKTPSAVIGVKGTDFIVGTVSGATNIVTLKGVVSFATNDNLAESVSVTKDRSSRILLGKPPTAPIKVDSALKKDLIKLHIPHAWNKKEIAEAKKANTKEKIDSKKIRKKQVVKVKKLRKKDCTDEA